MLARICAIVGATVLAIVLAVHPASAQTDPPSAAVFWKAVQARCNAAAAKPPSEVGRRIAQIAIDEFTRFDGHRIDSDGRLFRFGLTEAEHEEEDGGDPRAPLGHLGWWQVMKYWRALYNGSDPSDKLEVRGYRDASSSTEQDKSAEVLRTDAAHLLHAAEAETDPAVREVLREAALRGAVIDTPWSAAFVSYVIRQAGVAGSAFHFSNAHRVYIYDAFAAGAAEQAHSDGAWLYRACPLTATRPRPGDLICQQREPSLVDATEETVRERIRSELAGDPAARTVRRTHCEVVAFIDEPARKMYTIGGNVNQAVTARKLNLRQRGLKFSTAQGHCGGPGHWTLPRPAGESPHAPQKCSLNDRKWFVLLQLR